MPFLRLLLLLFINLISHVIIAQIPKHLFNEVSEETYDFKDFTNTVKPIHQYVGVYKFGMSEGEWEFVILENGDSLIVQIWDGIWANNLYTNEACFQRRCRTFNNVSVKGNNIIFGNYSGMLADFREGEDTRNALLLFCDPILKRNYGKDSAEVGVFLSGIDGYDDDPERHQLSVRVQPDSFFENKTKAKLRLMRNTIFANYGLIFQAGGAMEKHFREKDWYNPFLHDVSSCITSIEQKNLDKIARLEQL